MTDIVVGHTKGRQSVLGYSDKFANTCTHKHRTQCILVFPSNLWTMRGNQHRQGEHAILYCGGRVD